MFGLSEVEVKKLIAAERVRCDERIQEVERNFKKKLEAFETRTGSSAAEVSQQIRFSDITVTKAELLNDVVASVEVRIKSLINDAVGGLDLSELSERLYQDIDNDDLCVKIAEILKDKVFEELDQEIMAKAIAEVMYNEDLLDDDFTEQIAENVVDRLDINLKEKS